MAEVKIEPNSHKYKSEKPASKSIKKVVENDVTVKKPSPSKRLTDAFVAQNGETVRSYLIWDVLVPAVKDTVADLVKKGIDALLYGNSRPANVQRNGTQSYVSYSSYQNRRQDPPFNPDPSYRKPASYSYQRRTAHDFSDIILKSRSDAENVLDLLVESTMQYGEASVADFYELVGIQSRYTDHKFGWAELSDARVMQVRGGYILDLPRPEPLDR